MQSWEEEFKNIISELTLNLQSSDQVEALSKEDEKKLKKRIKKFAIEKDDKPESAAEKTKKLLEEVYKNYEVTAKQASKNNGLKDIIEISRKDRDSSVNQLKMLETLQKQFKKKYDDTLKEAQDIEKQEENKRKTLIEELQIRIKNVQEEYETAGKDKIEKYRENETLKHELSKIEPQTVTTESLMDAQLKKKEIENEITMTTLKQKIEMMNNFKKIGEETKEKLDKAEELKIKIDQRLDILNEKQNENNLIVARAHLVLDDYRKSIVKINDLLSKHEKEALKAQENYKKKLDSTNDLDKNIARLEKEFLDQQTQIQVLNTLEQTLKTELAQTN